jgi:hypothetical protein
MKRAVTPECHISFNFRKSKKVWPKTTTARLPNFTTVHDEQGLIVSQVKQ